MTKGTGKGSKRTAARGATAIEPTSEPLPEPVTVVESPTGADDPAATIDAAIGAPERAPVDAGAAVRALAPPPEPEGASTDTGSGDTGRSTTPGAERARRYRERQRQGKGAGTSGRKRKGGRPSYAEVAAERDALQERIALLENPQDAAEQRDTMRRALVATFAGVGFVAARSAPELALQPSEVDYLADAWMPVAEMHGQQLIGYMPYLSAAGSLVVVFAPKYQRYAERAEREAKEGTADKPEATERPWQPEDGTPRHGDLST